MSKSRRTRAGMLWVIGAALVAAFGVAALQQGSDGRWTRVETRDLVISVPIEGELKAVRSEILGPPSLERSGIWRFNISYLAPEGKEVAEGQPVIRFDTADVQQRLRQKMTDRASAEKELEKSVTDFKIERRDLQLQLAEAQAQLRKAKLATDVNEEVTAANEIKIARVDQRMAELRIQHLKGNLDYLKVREKSQIDSLTRRRRQAAEEVEQLQAAISAMTVNAPRAGTVIYYSDENIEKAKVGDSVWLSRSVLEIPDLSKMQIEAEIAEADAGHLRVGQEVTFRLDTHPDHEYKGRVEQIQRAVQAKSLTNPKKVIRAEVSVATTDTERMRPGMRLRGQVEIDRLPGVVVVPEEAVMSDASGAWVTTRSMFQERRLQPELGQRNDRWFEVLGGLQPGDAVRVQDAEPSP